MEGNDETTFDDKKLLKILKLNDEIENGPTIWATTSTMKHIFDTLIVKMSN